MKAKHDENLIVISDHEKGKILHTEISDLSEHSFKATIKKENNEEVVIKVNDLSVLDKAYS